MEESFNIAMRVKNPTLFPTSCATKLNPDTIWDQRLTYDSRTDFSKLTFDSYLSSFRVWPRSFDLHDISFQNWSLQQLKHEKKEKWRQFSLSKDHALKRILRAVIYGICTREDLDWYGNSITDDEEQKKRKKEELIERYQSATLYDWNGDEGQIYWNNIMNEREPKKGKEGLKVEVFDKDTQSTTEMLYKENPGMKIAWLNMANAHNCCGTYNTDFGGSQEEEVAPNTDTCATLGLFAEYHNFDVRVIFERGQPHIEYKNGYHIPPGGCYFTRSRFVSCEEKVESYCIAAAFADFRPRIPVFTKYSESSDFYSWFGFGSSLVKEDDKFKQRLMIDIIGTVKTAICENVECLILGASGCGAFKHDPDVEAELWRIALVKYGHFFKRVVFAILEDKRSPRNVKAFQEKFEKPIN